MAMGKKRRAKPRAEDFSAPRSSGWHVLCDDGWWPEKALDVIPLTIDDRPITYTASNGWSYEASFTSESSGTQINVKLGTRRTLQWFSGKGDAAPSSSRERLHDELAYPKQSSNMSSIR